MRSFSANASLLLLGTAFFLVSACKKSAEPLDYTKEYPAVSFIVDTTSSTGEMLLGSQSVETDVVTYLSDNGFTVNNLKSVKVSSITIETTNPSQDLNYFKTLEVRLSNQGAGNVIFASLELPDNYTGTSATITPADIDLKEYFKQNDLEFGFYGKNDLIIPEPIPMTAKVSVQVVAKLGN